MIDPMNFIKAMAGKSRFLTTFAIGALALALAACGGASAASPQSSSEDAATVPSNTSPPAKIVSTIDQPYLVFNQKWLEGLRSKALDVEDVDEVFSNLPDEVVVYPT